MPYPELKGLLTDVGTEELAHFEMIGAIVYQLTRNLSRQEIEASGFDKYFVDHTAGIYPVAASGAPFTAAYIQSKGDVITDLHENLAAEQKARTTYDNILRFVDDPDVADPIKFLREREIVHFQRFGEAQQSIWNDYGGVADKPLEIKENQILIYSVINGQSPSANYKCGIVYVIRKPNE